MFALKVAVQVDLTKCLLSVDVGLLLIGKQLLLLFS